MTRRSTDANHKDIATVLRLLALPFLDTSGAGGGLGDFLVCMPANPKIEQYRPWLLELEAKVIERESTGYIRYTKAQKEWRAKTPQLMRLTCTSASVAEKGLRELMGL